MITYVDSDAEAKKKPRTMKSQTQLETYSNRSKVMRSFNVTSSLPLQFVVTRTFLSLIDRVTKALTIDEDKPDMYEMEEEEDILRENLKNELNISNEDEDENFNPSFNFLIKNQLGVEFEIESISGFKFYNVSFRPDQSPDDRYINRILLKNNESYPITQSFIRSNNMTRDTTYSALDEQTQNQYQIMNFKMNVSG